MRRGIGFARQAAASIGFCARFPRRGGRLEQPGDDRMPNRVRVDRLCHILPVLSLAALLVCGCAARPVNEIAEPLALEAPLVQPEPVVSAEVTPLQRFQEVNQLYQAEKSRSAGLDAALAEQKAGRQNAETENEGLRKQVETLAAKAREMDAMRAKLDEAQKANLEMESALRDARRELLQERLAGVKRDQMIVALKIEKAKDARKAGVLPPAGPDRATDKPPPKNPPAGGADAAPSASVEPRPTGGGQSAADKAARQGATEKGTAVANP